VDTCFVSSFGTFVMELLQGLCTAPAWQSFALLALGDRAPPHHNLYAAPRGNHGEALFAVLWLPWGPPLPSPMATLGGGHPSGGPLCPRGRGYADRL
jgi:hypothetical protein